jgi:signal transduction histidine kinase
MELNVFQALGQVLGLYSNIAISWMAAVVADLVINKPLGLSPKGIEFKRSHLYDINPVGVGAMLMASLLSVATFSGLFGATIQPYAPFVAMAAAFVISPLIAWWTGGRYYLARAADLRRAARTVCCAICEREYEGEDMAHCPAYQGRSARCAARSTPAATTCASRRPASRRNGMRCSPPAAAAALPYLETGLGHYLLLMPASCPILALVLGVLYTHEVADARRPATRKWSRAAGNLHQDLRRAAAALRRRRLVDGADPGKPAVAQEESNRQTQLLLQEIESHQRTDEALQKAKQVADAANQAKSRYITAISHELRTPLNSILGYAQILDADPTCRPAQAGGQRHPQVRRPPAVGDRRHARHRPHRRRQADAGRQGDGLPRLHAADRRHVRAAGAQQGLSFDYRAGRRAARRGARRREAAAPDPDQHPRQRGQVHRARRRRFKVECRREMAVFEIRDTGPGIPAEDMERIFEPFVRGSTVQAGGSGVGLTIARMLTDLMGGEMQVSSTPGEGTLFRIRLFLPQVHSAQAARELPAQPHRLRRRAPAHPRRRQREGRPRHAAERARTARLHRRPGGQRLRVRCR